MSKLADMSNLAIPQNSPEFYNLYNNETTHTQNTGLASL